MVHACVILAVTDICHEQLSIDHFCLWLFSYNLCQDRSSDSKDDGYPIKFINMTAYTPGVLIKMVNQFSTSSSLSISYLPLIICQVQRARVSLYYVVKY